MEAKNFRIGNLITIDNPEHHPSVKEKPLVVVRIGNDNLSLIHTDPRENFIIPAYSQYTKFVRPIDISIEWLKMLGFKKGQFSYIIDETLEDWYTCEFRDGAWMLFQEGVGINAPLRYVHQLQNLFFALTGRELAIKAESSACS